MLVTPKDEVRLLTPDGVPASPKDLRTSARARSASAMFPNPVMFRLRANFKVTGDSPTLATGDAVTPFPKETARRRRDNNDLAGNIARVEDRS